MCGVSSGSSKTQETTLSQDVYQCKNPLKRFCRCIFILSYVVNILDCTFINDT